MSNKGILFAIRATTRRVADSTIAIFGLALALFAYESSRMSAFQNVQAQTGILDLAPSAASVLAIVLLLAGYSIRPTLRIHRHPIAGFSIASLFALSSLLVARNGFIMPQSDWFAFLARCIRSLSVIAMLACWMEALLPKRARDIGVIISLAVIALAGLNVLSALFKEGAAHILVAIVPFLSIACLYWHKDHETLEQASSLGSADAYAALKVDPTLMPRETTTATFASTLLNFLIPLGCYSFVFGYMHYAWIPTQDGTFASLAIQLAAALGTFVAGGILLFLVSAFWGRRKIELYNFFALSIMVLALCITALASDRFTFVYVVPLNIAQKIAMFFIWMAPFLIPHKTSAMTSWCWALLLYQTGKLASSTVSSVIDQEAYLVCAITFAGLLILGSIIGLVFGQVPTAKTVNEGSSPAGSNKPEYDNQELLGETLVQLSEQQPINLLQDLRDTRNGPSEAIPESNIATKEGSQDTDEPSLSSAKQEQQPAPNERQALVISCSRLAKAYQLTRREEEVLQLLSEGMTAKDIAETLVVSSSTAKTHMRNIYAKLGVHTQNELILMVHRNLQHTA